MGKTRIKNDQQHVVLTDGELSQLGIPRGAIHDFALGLAKSVRHVAETVYMDHKKHPGLYKGDLAGMVQSCNKQLYLPAHGFQLADLGRRIGWHYGDDKTVFKPQRVQKKKFAPTANPTLLPGMVLLGYRFDVEGGPDYAGVERLWLAKVVKSTRAMTKEKKNRAGSNNSNLRIDWVFGAPVPKAAQVRRKLA